MELYLLSPLCHHDDCRNKFILTIFKESYFRQLRTYSRFSLKTFLQIYLFIALQLIQKGKGKGGVIVEIELYSISPLTIDRTGQHHAMCGSRPGKEPLKHLTEDGQAPIRYRLFGRKNPFCRESGHDSSVFCAVACSIYQQRRTGCLSSRQTALNILLSIFHHTKYQQVQETPATCL